MFYADLHTHSRFSRACSKNCDIPALAWWALRKGVTVVGTGDFTHPAWAQELRETLVPAEPGLLRLRPDLEAQLRRTSPASCGQPVRFMLSAEISTIYRGGDRTRKVHHLLYAPTLEAADRITTALAKVGNLASDGRPILGLDSRHLLEITLNGGPGCYLVPAHIWTPWFAVLGSKSGFDTVAECYADLADQVFAVETGLSSDPPMNWMCSSLDSYRLVSNSDAHSPPMLGREATTFGTELDYFAMERALRTGQGLAGTVNFFPEGGRYHLDGHRKCGVRFEPGQTSEHDGTCPQCDKPLTIGVLNRVAELADRPAGHRPEGAAAHTSLVALPEIVGEIVATGPKSKAVSAEVSRLVAALGPELGILREVPLAEVSRAGGSLLGEAVARLRRGEVAREAGYDGEYGVIRLLHPGELAAAGALFDVPDQLPARPARRGGPDSAAGPRNRRPRSGPAQAGPPGADEPRADEPRADQPWADQPWADQPWANEPRADEPRADQPRASQPGTARPGASEPGMARTGPGQAGPGRAGAAGSGPPAVQQEGLELPDLDPDQRAAARAAAPLMIIAGPGTGKTRTLSHRIAAEVTRGEIRPESCLAITFTRRAAEELRLRLTALVPRLADHLTVTTFHGLGLMILREQHSRAGLAADFGVADDQVRLAVATELAGSARAGRALLAAAASDPERRELVRKALAARDLVDFDGLVELPVTLLGEDPALAEALRQRWPRVSVDEYQDIDAAQYALLRLLAGDGSGLTVIGDPDQAIYGFRGGDVGFFLRFGQDYPGASTLELTRNYRSSPAIVAGAVQAITPSTLVPGRTLRPVASFQDRGRSASRGTTDPPRSWKSGFAPKITFHEAADEQSEAAWIAEAIDRLLGGSSFHSLDSGRADGHGPDGIGLGDIAVLYRTDAQAGPLGQALTRAGLPFQKRSHDLLERRTGVAGIVREMSLLDGDAGARDTGDPTGGPVGASVAGTTNAAAAGGAGAAGVGSVGPRATGEAGMAEASRAGSTADSGSGSVADRLRRAVRRLASLAAGSRAVDVRAAGELLAPLARRCGHDMQRFRTEISLGAEVDALDPRAQAITLLTLHAAKGLEFDVVFLAGCEKDLLPLWLPGAGPGAAADQAEERRLLFVGMTRARTDLVLTCAARRGRRGTAADTGPSPFLAAIDPALLDRSAPPRTRRPAARQLRLL